MISEKYQLVLERVAAAAHSVSREADSIRLVVVTKGHPVELVQEVIEAGARILGENYVEEAQAKIEACEGSGAEWHMIGHVQSRKASPVVELFDYVHSLDRIKIARRFDRFTKEKGRKMPVLLECNVSGEESKYGWQAWREEAWDDVAGKIGPVLGLPNLEVRGLMTMAPLVDDPEMARPYFRRLRKLRDYLRERYPGTTWDELSMGMSNDFEAAIQEGATLVRIGTAIMGPRPCEINIG